MRILGIDPGATSGWCIYRCGDAVVSVDAAGEFAEDRMLQAIEASRWPFLDAAVIERPVGQGPTRPQVVDCAWVAGQLWRDMLHMLGSEKCHFLTRLQIRQVLTSACHGVVRVTNDATAWAALVAMHGDGSDRKPKRKKGVVIDQGGVLGSVTGHARAALAAAVAWNLIQDGQRSNDKQGSKP